MGQTPPIEWGLVVAGMAIAGAVLMLLIMAATGGTIAS